VDWVLLTNGAQWKAYKLRFEKPIQADEAFFIDLLSKDTKPNQLLTKLYLISKEAGGGSAMESYHQQQVAKSRYVVGQLLLSEAVLKPIRRELRRLFPGVRATTAELAELLRTEVLKRDVLEGERATAAEKSIRRGARRRLRAMATPDDAPSANVVAEGVTRPRTQTAPAQSSIVPADPASSPAARS
jgi:hypothetical protein